jgi:hypothetical protein
MITETNPSQFHTNPITYHENPYCKIEIEAKDHTNIIRSDARSWTRNPKDLWVEKIGGSTSVGIQGSQAYTTATLTKTLNITEAGYYRIYIRALRQAWNLNAEITLKLDSTALKRYNTGTKQLHYKWLDYGKKYLTTGDHSFEIDFNGKDCWVESVILHRIEDYTTDTPQHSHRLDIQNIEFTQNSVNELNTAKIELLMKEDWFTPGKNNYSNIVFDITDTINIFLGSDNNTKNMFGGYIIGYELSDDNTILTLNCIDRFLDLHREPAYLNYAIGVNPRSDEQSEFPHLQFASAIEAIRYLIEHQEFGINSYRLEYPYGFYLNLTDQKVFENITVNGFSKVHDKRAGNPPPCLRLGIDKFNVDSCGIISDTSMECVLFNSESNPYDATEYDILNFNYMSPGISSTDAYKLQFNVEVTMYKDGESVTDAKAYNILFTGKTGASNVIGSVKPVLNGRWQEFKPNLKTFFDNYSASNHYYITKVRLVNTVTQSEVDNRDKSIMYIDNPYSFDSDINTTMHIDQETDYPFMILQKICEEIGYTAYIEYARERKDDCLILAPIENDASTQLIIEGSNVVNVYNKTYAPKETISNRALRHYHYTRDETEYTGVAYAENLDSFYRYGPFQHYENMSDTTLQADADKSALKHINDNAYGLISFSMDIIGSTLLEPSQYFVTSLKSHYLNGNYSPKAIIHTVNFKGDAPSFKTQIDVGQPSQRFRDIIVDVNKQVKRLIRKDNRSMYDSRALSNLGFASPGAFIKQGI